MDLSNLVSLFSLGLVAATPLILAGVGGIFGELSGVINIGLEGIMLFGALSSVLGTFYTGNPWWGVLIGGIAGGLIALIHAFFSITMKANQIISGLAINILGSNLTIFIMYYIFGTKGTTPSIESQLPYIRIPIISNLHPLLANIFTQPPLVYLGIILIFTVHIVLTKTTFGLHVKAAGEFPHALEVAGIKVVLIRYICVVIGGVFSGLGGAHLSISMMEGFGSDMIAGRGFLALAAIIFGRYTSLGTAMACLIFGIASASEIILGGIIPIHHNFIRMIPYLLPILALMGVGGETNVPSASGKSFNKGEKI